MIADRAARFATWAKSRPRLVVGVAASLIGIAALSMWAVTVSTGCYSRDAATARVAALSTKFQEAAATGTIKIDALATGIRRMNAAATSYNADADHAKFCDALDQVRGDFNLDS